MKLSLVVPCFNEAGNVEKMYEEVVKVLGNECCEVVFVNDGSRDNSAEVLKKLYEANDNIQVINFSRNFGKEAAMLAGLESAKGEYVCVIDADLQQPVSVAKEMMDILDEKPDIDCVTAFQKSRSEGGLMSFMKSCFYKFINSISEVNFVNGASDFRMMRRTMVDAVISMTEYHRFSKGIFSWVGFNTEYIPYEAQERHAGKTKWSTRKLFKYALEGIISFSTKPLRFATYVGFLSSVLSVIYMLEVILEKFMFGIDVPGYATIVVLVLLLGGLQLFCLGVLGEYLAKMYIQVKDRPVYIVREKLSHQDKNK